jgi:PAS domain S-box-containing protein
MSPTTKVLIVDDEELIRLNLGALLTDSGYQVAEASNGREGLEVFDREKPDLVLADLRMPVMDGVSMIEKLHECSPEIPIIVISGTGSIQNAVDSLRFGAWDYIIKPVEDVKHLEVILERALEKAQLIRENRRYQEHLEELVRERTRELRESEARYRKLLESITTYVYTVTFKNGQSDATIHGPGCEALSGFTPEEYAADPHLWYRMVPPDDRPMVIEAAKRILDERAPISVEHRIHHKDGALRWIRNTLVPHRSSTGELISYDGIVVDITESKQAQEEIERISHRNRLILESAGEGIFGLDTEGRVSFINRAAAGALGYDTGELLGQSIHELVHMCKETGTPYPREECPICLAFINGTTQNSADEVFWRKDGTSFPVEYTSTPIMENRHPVGAVVTFKDITEREKTVKQLQQAQKMEAIGVLAGGIAHDFNNILSSIFGFTELAKSKLATGENIMKDLDEVLQAGFRARDLVKHILLFSRQVDIQRTPLVLSPLVKECLKFLRASVPSTIEIRSDISVSTGTVVADPTEIHQIIMNICTNAAHAMAENGGTLDVRLAEYIMDNESIPPDGQMEPGRYYKLTIADTGHGIPAELMDRIFEPFFSTKERGEGTGLGLSIVHGIVIKLNGAISVKSEPGKGTTFHVWLPLHEEEVEKVSFTNVLNEGRKGKILFVDDENTIVITAKGLLEKLGYTVMTTTSPLHALEMARSGEHRFDLVITDLTMPKMTGIELSKKLHIAHPDIPVILCTGFSAAISQEKLVQAGIREVIMKPMISSELAETIDRALNAGEREEERV